MQYQQVEPNIYTVYKPAGYTPLQALNVLRAEAKIVEPIPLTYAGRLDPMAEGLLIVLAGEAVHRKDEFLKLDKRYTVTALLGVETDSFDLLGMPKKHNNKFNNLDSSFPNQSTGQARAGMTGGGLGEEQIQRVLKSYTGDITLPLPLYSSPPVEGKPLFAHAQQQTMEAHDAPMRTTRIFSCELKSMGNVNGQALAEYIGTTIATIHGEFRQEAILHAWRELLSTITALQTFTLDVQCSSGTYIRSLINTLGGELGTCASVYSLVRTQVGNFKL